MEGHWQRDWRNVVPKQTKPTGMRVSLNSQSTLQMTPEPR
jgi:hypothetical protein